MDTWPCRERFPGLDAARGCAICMMVVYHILVDIAFLGAEGPDPFSGPVRIFGYGTAALFILIAGIAASIRMGRCTDISGCMKSFLARGGELILLGAGITVVTWVFLDGEGYVIYGILSLIGTGLILSPVLLRYPRLSFISGLVLVSGAVISLPHGPLWLVWTGIHPDNFYSVDYTPVIPWLGFFLLGGGIGSIIYPGGTRRMILTPSWARILNPLIIPGRHSLIIYLVHQPVILGILAYLTSSL